MTTCPQCGGPITANGGPTMTPEGHFMCRACAVAPRLLATAADSL